MVSLVECFWSFQGEGPWVGAPTFFVRTAGCPLRCTYCDTVESYVAPGDFEVRDFDGSRLAELANPVESGALLSAPWCQPRGSRCWLSLTGGEPLLWPEFCREIFEGARQRGFATHLESAALDASALKRVLPFSDHLSLDYKLPSTLKANAPRSGTSAEAHLDCLAVAVDAGVETSLKIVLTPRVGMNELTTALKQIAPWRKGFCLVLQPVTPCLDEVEPLDKARLLRMAGLALDMDFGLRVLPQVHKSLGLA